jgi:hypothetical protein
LGCDGGTIWQIVPLSSDFDQTQVQEWDKVKTDWLKIGEIVPKSFGHSASRQGAVDD